MEIEILKLVYDYSINKKIIDRKYVEKLVEIVITATSLNNYVRNIFWSSELEEIDNKFKMAGYDLIGRNLKVSIPAFEMALEHYDRYDCLFNDIEHFFYRNLLLTQFILHELEHANQNKMVDLENEDLETKLLTASFMTSQALKNPRLLESIIKGEISIAELTMYIEGKHALYYQYYEHNPSERLAEIKSYAVINQILDKIKDYVPNLSQFEKASLVEQMLRGYNKGWDSVDCPTETYLLGTGPQNTKIWTQFDFFDLDPKKMQEKVNLKYDLQKKLTYGLPVNYEEYDQTAYWLYSTNKFM